MVRLFNIPTLYINLDSRHDRKLHIENQLKDFKNVERIPAIKTTNGYFGCVQSHIKALEHAKSKNYNQVLILEDDFEFENIEKFVYPEIDFDVCLLEAYVQERYKVFATWNYYKVKKAQHTGGYIVEKHFYDKLIENFKESNEKLKSDYCKDNYLDIYWFKLQDIYTFFYPSIPMGKQIEGYSDIKNENIKRY